MLVLAASAWGADPAALADARRAIERHVADSDPLVAHLAEVADLAEQHLAAVGPSAGASKVVLEQVALSLDEKADRALVLDASTLRSTVIDYEAFKLETYVTSGVFPKRYFGYVDGRSDTAADEIEVLKTAQAAVYAVDGWQAAHQRPVGITEVEVVTTFLAEGGALWLGTRTELHPVLDVGLDDVASGARDSADLIAVVDGMAGTDLGGLVAWTTDPATVKSAVPDGERWLQHANGDAGPFPYLTRYMTVKEAVAGTAVMYLWEKERADRLLAAKHAAPISGRSLDEQFVIGSLVYNSGLLHDSARWKAILGFSTGGYVRERSVTNQSTRPPLNLLAPPDQLREIASTGRYRDQNTSWLAVYHVLQRYGAFVALRRFTDRFGPDGAITSIPARPRAPAPARAPAPPLPPPGCGCSGAGVPGALVPAWPILALRYRRRAPQTRTSKPRL